MFLNENLILWNTVFISSIEKIGEIKTYILAKRYKLQPFECTMYNRETVIYCPMIKHKTEWLLNEYVLYENKLRLKFIQVITLSFVKTKYIHET
jgi:hypothetical protein